MTARARRARTGAPMAALLAALLVAGCSRGGDVLLITVDTLRADHVGLYGYDRPTTPNLDRWFGDWAVYLRAYSTEANTSPSVVSILSGQLPQFHRVRLLYQLAGPDLEIVPALLPPAYQRAAFVSNIVLTDEAIGLARYFDHYDDHVDEPEPFRAVFERTAARTTDAALAWLTHERATDRPLFLWVHYIDPHGPYRPPAPWARAFTHATPKPIELSWVPTYQRGDKITDGLAYVDAYDGEIAYVDHEIGRLLEGYAQRYPVDRALIIFTADHGESMMDHERWFSHGYQVYDEIVRVPLMVRGPGTRAGRFEQLTSGTDLAPTMLRFVGRAVPAAMPAVDLRDQRGLDDGRTVFAEATQGLQRQWRAAIQGGRKWMVQVGPGKLVALARAYDLRADPHERTRRPWSDDDPARALLDLCRSDPDPAGLPEQYAKGVQLLAPKVAPGISAEAKARLKALGYAE